MLFFGAICSTCVVYTKTIIHLGVDEYWWIFAGLRSLHLSVNNC